MNSSLGVSFTLALYALALPLSLSITNAAVGCIVILGLTPILLKEKKINIPLSFVFLFLFFSWALCTAIVTTGYFKISHLEIYRKTWNFLPLIFLPLLDISEKKIKHCLKILLGLASLLALLGALQYWKEIHFFFEGWFQKGLLVIDRRFYGFQSYPLHTAGLYTVLFCLASNLFLNYGSRSWERCLWGMAALWMALAVLLTGSRSYYLGLIAALLCSLSFQGWKIFGFILLMVLLGIGFVAKREPYIQNRILSINPYHTDESGRQRVRAWKTAWKMATDHPFVGVGYKKWGENLPRYLPEDPTWELDPAIKGHAHNSALNIAAETGFVGLFLMGCFWVLFIQEEARLLKKYRSKSLPYALALATLSATAAILVASLFEHNFFTATVSLSLFFVAALSRLSPSTLP